MRLLTTMTLLALSRLLPAQCNFPVTIGPIPTLCNGDGTYQLTATPAGGSWSGNQISASGLVHLTALFGGQSATYLYADSTCTDTVTAPFQVIAAPNVNAGTDFTIVCGNTAHLNGSFTQGPNNTAFWTTADGHITGAADDMNTPIDAPGTYVLTAVDNATGCTRRDTVVCYPYLPSFPHSEFTDTICQGSTLLGYAVSGHFYDKYETGAPCDSFRVLHLTVLPPRRDTLFVTTCVGVPVEGYSASGIYLDTFPAVNGCDSIRLLDLTVLPTFASSASASTCDPAQAGVFLSTFPAANGCDSVVTITVQLLPSPETPITAAVCAGSFYENYGSSGVYRDTFAAANGCDSIRLLYLTVLPAFATNLSATTCDPAQAGVFLSTFPAANGCDSVVTTTTTLLPSSDTLIVATLCAGSFYENYGATGTYTDLFTNQYGCDSTRVLDLTVLPLPTVASDIQPDHGTADGSIAVTPLGGSAPFQFVWSTGDTSSTLTALSGGTYTLTLTDAAGCSAEFSFLVPSSVGTSMPANSPFRLSATPNPVRAGQPTRLTLQAPAAGTYRVSVFDATGRLSRQWLLEYAGGSTDLTLSFPGSGIQVLRVTDAAGRSALLRLAIF